ncbi:MAG: hypothetical protein V3T83_21345 [Acidobacteriota bacterium]
MRTAVSIPGAIFDEAEQTAKEQGISRSRLDARALQAYLKKNRGQSVTGRLNQVYGKSPSRLDPVLSEMQWMSLGKDEWK